MENGDIVFDDAACKRAEKVIQTHIARKKWFLANNKAKQSSPKFSSRPTSVDGQTNAIAVDDGKLKTEGEKDQETVPCSDEQEESNATLMIATVSKNPWKEAEMEEKKRQDEIRERELREIEARRIEEEQKRLVEEEERRQKQKEREERTVLLGAIRLQALYRRRVARADFRTKCMLLVFALTFPSS